MPQSGKVIDN